MITYNCDKCCAVIKTEVKTVQIPVHITNPRVGQYVNLIDMEPISGKSDTFHLCLKCDNELERLKHKFITGK